MTEILQLEKQDIIESEGVWVIRFDDMTLDSKDDQKRLKQEASRREVPIHKNILKLRFLDYVKTRNDRLFPDEPRSKTDKKFDAFQKRHTYYRKRVKVVRSHEKEMRDFHSFRHTVETKLSGLRFTVKPKDRFDFGVIDSILGHASRDRSEGQKTYDHEKLISIKKRALDSLEYSCIDFNKIKPWDKCDFNRKPFRSSIAKKLRKK